MLIINLLSKIYLVFDVEIRTKKIVPYYMHRSTALNQRERDWRIWETEIKNNLRRFSHLQQGNWSFDGSF